MKNLFLDESGDCSFSPYSPFRHFVITVLTIDSQNIHKIKNHLKRQFVSFLQRGWSKKMEIKAFNLYANRIFGAKAISSIINSLAIIPTLEINYIAVNKAQITNQSFRNAPYSTAYNYFAGVLLSEMVFIDGLHSINLTYDLRNKETSQKRHFKEYLETEIYGTSLEENIDTSVTIIGGCLTFPPKTVPVAIGEPA